MLNRIASSIIYASDPYAVYLTALNLSYRRDDISTTVFSPSTICESISPTAGAVPNPCPVNPHASISPGTSSTSLMTGTPS